MILQLWWRIINFCEMLKCFYTFYHHSFSYNTLRHLLKINFENIDIYVYRSLLSDVFLIIKGREKEGVCYCKFLEVSS